MSIGICLAVSGHQLGCLYS